MFNTEQIVALLRPIEVLMAQGKSTPEACREAGISQQSYYRWRKEYGGLEIDQAKRISGGASVVSGKGQQATFRRSRRKASGLRAKRLELSAGVRPEVGIFLAFRSHMPK
jgi:transposase